MNQRYWRKHTNLSRNNIIFYVQKKPFGVLQELVIVTKGRRKYNEKGHVCLFST